MQQAIQVALTSKCNQLFTECHALTNEVRLGPDKKKMSPEIEVTVTNLDDDKSYFVGIHVEVVGDTQHIYKDGQWIAGEPIKEHGEPKIYILRSASRTGREWMQGPINFGEVNIKFFKIYHNDDALTIYVHRDHKYVPVITIFEVMPDRSLTEVYSTKFPQAEFIPVAKYNNGEVMKWKRMNVFHNDSAYFPFGSSGQSSSSMGSSVTPQLPPLMLTPPHHQPVFPTGPIVPVPATRPVFPVLATGSMVPVPVTGPMVPVPATGPMVPVPATGPIAPVPATEPIVPVPATGPMVPVPATGPIAPVPATEPIVPVPATGPMVPVPATGPFAPVPATGPIAPVPATGPVFPGLLFGPIPFIPPNPNHDVNPPYIIIPTHSSQSLVIVKTPFQPGFLTATLFNPSTTQIAKNWMILSQISLHDLPNWIVNYFALHKHNNYPKPPSDSDNIGTWYKWHVSLSKEFPIQFPATALALTYSNDDIQQFSP